MYGILRLAAIGGAIVQKVGVVNRNPKRIARMNLLSLVLERQPQFWSVETFRAFVFVDVKMVGDIIIGLGVLGVQIKGS